MNKLIVLYPEDKNNAKNSWSGTSYSLRKALEKYYDVIFIDVALNKVEDITSRVIVKLGKYVSCNVVSDIFNYFYCNRIIRKLNKYKDIPVLEIGCSIILDRKYYVYHDMSCKSWDYVDKQINKTGKDFKNGNFNIFCKAELNRRVKVEKQVLSNASKVFYMGNWVNKLMQEYYPDIKDKFIAVGGGVNNEFNLSTKPKIKNQILFVGLDFERKGGYLVLEAFDILINKYISDAKLIIIGVDKIKDVKNVTWLGRISREESSKYFAGSQIFCMPSIFEAYGLVFVESLCFGLPVVARDDYEMHYFVEHGKNGYLIDKEDADLLAKYMAKALNNEEMKERVQREAINYQKRYSWDSVAYKIANVIDNEESGNSYN